MSSQQTAQSGQERSRSTGTSQWSGWVAAVVGLWILITPFFWGGGGTGGVNWLFWSNIVSGIVIAGLAGYAASRSGGESQASGAGWAAAVVGLWVLITPFFLGGGASGVNWLFWSNIVSGIVVAVLAGWTANR